jgi:YggT family protein
MIFSNFLMAFAKILHLVLDIYMWIIIIRAIISWVNPDPYHPLVRFLYAITEPVMGWLRRRLPLLWGGFDLSPLLLILAIVFIQNFWSEP